MTRNPPRTKAFINSGIRPEGQGISRTFGFKKPYPLALRGQGVRTPLSSFIPPPHPGQRERVSTQNRV